jgi:hypothetical protein
MLMPSALALARPDVPIIGGEPHGGAPIACEFNVRTTTAMPLRGTGSIVTATAVGVTSAREVRQGQPVAKG